MRTLLLAATALALPLAACDFAGSGDTSDPDAEGSVTTADNSDRFQADAMASNDAQASEDMAGAAKDDKPRPIMQAQVVLDRLGFTPGVVDGKMGLSTVNAIKGFQEAKGMTVTGKMDEPTKQALAEWNRIPATRVVTIPESFANEEFTKLPKDPKDQAKLDRLGYESLDEKLAERFHTTVAVLREMNPNMDAVPESDGMAQNEMSVNESATKPTGASAFRAGQKLRVPNVGADRIASSAVKDKNWQQTLTMLGVGTEQPTAAKVVVDKSDQVLRVLDGEGKLLAQFTATMGSKAFPLPLGTWKIQGTGYNPEWSYDPALLATADKSDPKLQIPAGPNNPIGVVWIDLSKEHYGIHGTNEPERIGRAESNGCIRLTNWDAVRLAQMVKPGTVALFQA